MKYEVEAFDIFSAYSLLRLQQEELNKPLEYNGFIDITKQIKSGNKPEQYKGLGFLWGYCVEEPGENANKTRFSIEEYSTSGVKNWLTKYLVSKDYPNIINPILNEKNEVLYFDLKKQACDFAKEWTSENKRSSHIILTKVPENFKKLQTSYWYKPAPKDKQGVFIFFN